MADIASAAPARPANLLHAAFAAGVAAIALVVADLVVRLVPFRLVARRIESKLRRTAPASEATVARVAWAIAAAHRRLPWTVPCLATAIAANRLLAWRGVGSELWLGVKTNEQTSVSAHAWLVANGRVVTGAREKKQFRPLHALVTSAPLP